MRDRMMRSTQKKGEEIAGLIRTQEEAENRVKELFKPRIAAAKTLCEKISTRKRNEPNIKRH